MEKYNVIIIGSGAAAYSTADWLARFGEKKILMLTEGRKFGTSRNAGSDKQTYYKMSFTDADCAQDMAKALSSGGGMHLDTAMIEAVNSIRCFMRLVEYGVPFPTDELGRFIGYKTDHDTTSRATSAGPLTSKYMTECLERQVMKNEEIRIVDGATVVKVVTDNNCVLGVIYLTKTDSGYDLVPVAADYVVMATGGAASVYARSVFPKSQTGAVGLAIEAGCKLNNITEWQYGIASTKVRWNLSGSYQQVIPTYYSVDENGVRRDFLPEKTGGDIAACNEVFLKGYQWPFDSRKVEGSSKVDLAVNEEIKNGRKVFMDFRTNPTGYSFEALSDEAKNYLNSADANAETPFERLKKLNPKAIAFYRSKGIDLENEPLEIAVCAQHMNGGVDVDINWMTSVKNLFAVGEAAGTFGVYRPGGSALNSTQVGGLRIAQYISTDRSPKNENDDVILSCVEKEKDFISRCLNGETVPQVDFSQDMSNFAGHCRIYEEISALYERILNQTRKKYFKIEHDDFKDVLGLYKYKDNITTQLSLCKTMLDTLPLIGSRGGAVFFKDNAFVAENESYREKAIVSFNGETTFEQLRTMPDLEFNFERSWKKYCLVNDIKM